MSIYSGLNACEIVSEYFATKTVMDDSLSEFQEKKRVTGTKTQRSQILKMSKNTKVKSKKGVKFVRGQKDIRTAFKGKKNELISYSKDFDEVCKKSGIDVDSEQLQLAIALSKSLQQSKAEDSGKDSQNLTSLCSQERTSRIRTTLLEYGFKVPEIKTTVSNKKIKQRRKNYKLLSTTDNKRSQIISDRYSQVLFQNPISLKDNNLEQTDFSSIPLYYIATNISYNSVKNNEIYYVGNLIEKSLVSSTGSLLRDWSEIPGRPVSPSLIVPSTCFKDIEFSEDNLDIFLSGPLKIVKEIIKNTLSSEHCGSTSIISDRRENIVSAINVQSKLDTNVGSVEEHIKEYEQTHSLSRESELNLVTMMSQQCRSLSPDIFEDEVSSIMESPKIIPILEPTCNVATKEINYFMDLTECVLQSHVSSDSKPNSQLSQGSNRSKRKSYDFMEITECVATTSQPIIERIPDKIHMAQNCNPDVSIISVNKTVLLEANVQNEGEKMDIEHMDLTQFSSDEDTLPFVQISGNKNKSLDNTIILGDTEYIQNVPEGTNKIIQETATKVETLDLTQRHLQTTLEERVPSISAKNPKKRNSKSVFEEYLYHHSDHSNKLNINKDTSNSKSENNINDNMSYKIDMDLTQSSKSSEEAVILNIDPLQMANVNIERQGDVYRNETMNCKIDIDLTQSSKSSEEATILNDVPCELIDENLGRQDNVSIDYDQIDTVGNYSYSNHYNSDEPTNIKDIEILNRETTSHNVNVMSVITTESNAPLEKEKFIEDLQLNSSQVSQVFKVSDNELNYSLHKSNQEGEHFEFGGVSSVMGELSNIQSFNIFTRNNVNCTNDNSFLPAVNINSPKGLVRNNIINEESCKKTSNSEAATPLIETVNSEYIINTDQVTPRLDYESMSTPNRNKELGKYGLKPLKRKRAIQLLTHIYNQTHPIVEVCSDLPSPSKKRKHEEDSKKSTLPKKPLKFPETMECVNNVEQSDNENSLYEITNELPDIKNVECDSEDWVFKKREKAKVRSCSLPLHIAFHNYISCRQKLREAILRYEPVNIDLIHKQLSATGHRYDPKALLKFMDKKCITVKTTDSD